MGQGAGPVFLGQVYNAVIVLKVSGGSRNATRAESHRQPGLQRNSVGRETTEGAKIAECVESLIKTYKAIHLGEPVAKLHTTEGEGSGEGFGGGVLAVSVVGTDAGAVGGTTEGGRVANSVPQAAQLFHVFHAGAGIVAVGPFFYADLVFSLGGCIEHTATPVKLKGGTLGTLGGIICHGLTDVVGSLAGVRGAQFITASSYDTKGRIYRHIILHTITAKGEGGGRVAGSH